MNGFCNCRDCKKMRKKGKVLGTRIMGFWLNLDPRFPPEYYQGPVSDYVPFPRFAKGRRIKREKNNLRREVQRAASE